MKHDEKPGFVLVKGQIRRTARQKRADRAAEVAAALAAIFAPLPANRIPKGFRVMPPSEVQEEDLATRHDRTMRRLFQ